MTFSHQPPEVFRGAFLSLLPGVGAYEATVCNLTDTGLRLSEGVLAQAANRGAIVNGKPVRIGTVSPVLALTTLQRARKRSKLYTIMRVTEWIAWAGTSIVSTGIAGDVSKSVRLAFPLIAGASDRVASAYDRSGIDLSIVMGFFLDPNKPLLLDARGCASKVFLGEYRRSFEPFEVPILP